MQKDATTTNSAQHQRDQFVHQTGATASALRQHADPARKKFNTIDVLLLAK